MKTVYNRQGGFTLIELLISIAIMGILLTAVFNLLDQSLRSWRASSNKTELQQTARHAVDSIVKDVQYAKGVIINNSDKQITIITDQYGTDSTIIYTLNSGAENKLTREVSDSSGNQSVTGDNMITIKISKLEFSPLVWNGANSFVRTLGIGLTATDAEGNDYEIITAITANNAVP